MPELPEAGAQLTLDTSAWDAAYNRVVKQASDLDNIIKDVGGTVEIDVRANTDQILADLDKLDSQRPSVAVDVDLEGTEIRSLLDLDSEVLTPKIDPTLNDAPVERVKDLDSETVTPKVDAQETASSKEVVDKLNKLAELSVINIAIEAGGSAVGFVQQFARIGGVAGIFEMDDALAKIQARTGEMLPDAEHLINELYANGWGESRDAIAEVLIQAQNLNISMSDLETATQNALIISQTYGEDTSEVLRTMDSLVKNDLAKDFDEAADILVTGFQEGANRGQDLLDTFNEYGTTFAGAGISGAIALSLINTGLEAGIDNSDRVADAVREIGIRLNEIGSDDTITQAFKDLDALSDVDLSGLLDAYRAGEISGDEYFEGFFTALDAAASADPQAAARIATSLIGTQAEDFGVETFTALATAFDTSMTNIEGRAADAGNEVSNTLGAQLDELFRSVEVAAQDFLSSEQIDLPGKIEAIKGALTEAIDVLQSGGTLGEALEVGFKIQGVDEFLNGFQSTIGNFAINLLEMIANIQDFLGKDSTGTRSQVAQMAEGQLAFDLKLADGGEEITNAIQAAIARGVDMETIGQQAGTSIEELLAQGSVGAAQRLIEEIQFQGEGFKLSPEIDPLFGEGVMLQNSLNTWIENRDLDMINQAISKGLVVAPEGIDVSELQAQVDNAVATLTEQFNAALAGGDINAATAIANQLADPMLIEQVNTLAEAMEGVTTTDFSSLPNALAESGEAATAAAADMAAGVIPEFDAIGTAATAADVAVTSAVSGNTMTKQFTALKKSASSELPATSREFANLRASAASNFRAIDGDVQVAINALNRFDSIPPILQRVAQEALLVAVAIAKAAAEAQKAIDSIKPPSGGGSTGGGTGGGGGNKVPVPTAMAYGGDFTAGQPLLFEGFGPEVVSFNKPGSVIGVEQTRQLMSGGALGGTVINNYNNINLVQNNNVQSQAQAAAAGYAVAKEIRGMSS